MTKEERGLSGEVTQAEDKLSEIVTVLGSARSLLANLVKEVEAERDGAKNLLVPLSNLHKLFAAYTRAEEEFHEKYGAILQAGDIDFAAARASIGGKLDRLRTAQDTGGIS